MSRTVNVNNMSSEIFQNGVDEDLGPAKDI